LLSTTGLEFESSPDGVRLISPKVQEDEAYVLPATDIIGAQGAVFDKYKSPEIKYEVTREQLDRMPYSRISDIFNGVPGVSSADGSNGASLELNIRGLQGMSRIKTLVDGSMQTSNIYTGYSGNKDRTFIDPDLIGGIDIKKGPDAGPQGAGVVGGIVNMRTINASDIITDLDKNWGIRIKGMYGNNVAQGRHSWAELHRNFPRFENGQRIVDERGPTSIYYIDRKTGRGFDRVSCRAPSAGGCANAQIDNTDIGGPLPTQNIAGSLALAFRPLDDFEITLAYAERESGNYYPGKRGKDSWKGVAGTGKSPVTNAQEFELVSDEVMNTSHRSDSWLVKSKLAFWNDHSVEFSHIKYRAQYGQFMNINGYSRQQSLQNAQTTTYALNYAWQPDSALLDLRTNLWKSRTVSESPSSIRVYDWKDKSEVATDSFGGELWNSNNLDLPLGELSLKYGISISHEQADGFATDRRGQQYTTSAAKGTRRIYGAFSQGNWQITPWLSANAALQYTQGKLQSNAPPRCFGATCYDTPSPNQQRAVDPSYGFTLQPHHRMQLFAQWSHGSRMPTVRESLMPNSIVYPNPDLKMEKAKNFEYGVNLLFDSLLNAGDSLGIKFSKFDNKYNDYIVRTNSLLTGRSQQQYYIFDNIDRARYQGYELAADYDSGWLFGNFGLVYFDNVKYCYARAKDDNIFRNVILLPKACHNEPPLTDYGAAYVPPKQEKNAGLGVRLFDQKLVLGATMKMSTKAPKLQINSALTPPTYQSAWDNYEIYDIYGQLKLSQNLELGFSVENITDRFYVPSYSSISDGVPAPGRTARWMFTFRF